MMYLVLTALLALNVSSEILNAFKTVNNSLEKTNSVITASTKDIMTSLDNKKKDPTTADKANVWYPKAEQVQQKSTEIYNYIQSLKDRILTEAGGDPKDASKVFKEDNLDIATRIMIEKGEGKKLEKMLNDYKAAVLGIDPKINASFANSLPLNLEKPQSKNKAGKTWEGAYFHMVPTVASLTILSKFQNDIKTTENKVVTFCHEQVGKVEVVQDAFTAIAVANSTNVLPGQDIEITAGVGGFSSKAQPVISIDGQSIKVGEDGAAHHTIKASSIGTHVVNVNIQYTDQNGKTQTIPKKIEYTVGQSNAAVQLDKMNVLFIGVDNPITISGSGSVDQLQVSASGGGATLLGSGAKRSVRVTSETDDCTISIRTADGKVTPVKFRVRSIPDPSPRVGANESGDVPAGVFKSQGGVNATVKNFFYETQFNVTGFRIIGDGAGFDDGVEEAVNSGAAWNEARKIISKCRPGSVITIDNIRAVGPDNRSRKLSPLVFELK